MWGNDDGGCPPLWRPESGSYPHPLLFQIASLSEVGERNVLFRGAVCLMEKGKKEERGMCLCFPVVLRCQKLSGINGVCGLGGI